MNKEVKQKWVAALRSGDYKQTQNHLQDSNGYCCLGVLCDLYAQEHEEVEWSDNLQFYPKGLDAKYERYFDTPYEFDEELPPEVMSWAGLDRADPVLVVESENNKKLTCIDCNDNAKMNFNEIADLVEKHL